MARRRSRTVDAAYVPVASNAGDLAAMANAYAAFGENVSGIGGDIKKGAADWAGHEEARVENYLKQFPNDISRRNALAELMNYDKQAGIEGGTQIGRFTDFGNVSETLDEMQLRDMKVEERAEQAANALRLEDAFQYEKGRRDLLADREKQTFESDLAYSKARTEDIETDNEFQKLQHKLEQRKQDLEDKKQTLARDKFTQTKEEFKAKAPGRAADIKKTETDIALNEEKILVAEQEYEKYERAESIKINVEGQADTYTTILGLEGTRPDMPKGEGIKRLQEDITKNRNDRVTNTEQKVLIDILNRHILETETTGDIATALDAAGGDTYKNWTDFSISGKSKLKNLIYKDLLERYSAADPDKLKDYAALAITNSSYNDKFNKAIAIEKLGPVPLRNHKNRLLMERYSREMLTSKEDNYVNNYTTKRNDLVAKQATAEHLRVFDTQFRSKALQSFSINLDTPEAKKLEFISKNTEDVTRSDIARLKAYIKKIAKGPKGFKNLDASELKNVTNRTILDNNLHSKLIQTELDITADEEAAAERTKLAIREKISKKTAIVEAKEAEDKFRTKASSRGQLGFNEAVRSPVADYLTSVASGDGWFLDDGSVDPDVIGKRINKVQRAIEQFAGPGFSIGDKAVAVRDLLLTSNIKENAFTGNQIRIRLKDGTLKTVKEASPLELFIAAMSTTKAVPATVGKFRSQIERFQKGQLERAKVALENEIKSYTAMAKSSGINVDQFLEKYNKELAEIKDHLEKKNYGAFSKYTRNILYGDSNNPGYDIPYRGTDSPSAR